jgi:hypothetical protein
MWLMKTLLTSGCTNQLGAGQSIYQNDYLFSNLSGYPWLSLLAINGFVSRLITAVGLATSSLQGCQKLIVSGNHFCITLVRQHQATMLERCSREEMNMKRCTRCNKKRNFIERLFALDKELCEECLYDIQLEIRERREIPVKRHKD